MRKRAIKEGTEQGREGRKRSGREEGARKGVGKGAREGSEGGERGREGREEGRKGDFTEGHVIRTLASIQCTKQPTTRSLPLRLCYYKWKIVNGYISNIYDR